MPRDRDVAAAVSGLAIGSGEEKKKKKKKKKKKRKEEEEKEASEKKTPSKLMVGEGVATSKKSTSTTGRKYGKRSGSSSSSSSSGCCVDAAFARRNDDGADPGDQKKETGGTYGGVGKATGRRKSARHGRSRVKAIGTGRGSVAPVVPVISRAALAAGGGGVLGDEKMRVRQDAAHSELPFSQQRKSGDSHTKGDRDGGELPPPSELDLTPAVAAAKHHQSGAEDTRSSTSSICTTGSDNPRTSSTSSPSTTSSCSATPETEEKTQSHATSSRSSISTQQHYQTRGATSSVLDKSSPLPASKEVPPVDGRRPERRNKRSRPSGPLPASHGGGEGSDAPTQGKSGAIIIMPAGEIAKETSSLSCPIEGSCSARDDVRGIRAVTTSHDDHVAVSDRSHGSPADAEPLPLSGFISREETEAGVPGGVLRESKETAAQEYGELPVSFLRPPCSLLMVVVITLHVGTRAVALPGRHALGAMSEKRV